MAPTVDDSAVRCATSRNETSSMMRGIRQTPVSNKNYGRDLYVPFMDKEDRFLPPIKDKWSNFANGKTPLIF
jgi:hypothetical protein